MSRTHSEEWGNLDDSTVLRLVLIELDDLCARMDKMNTALSRLLWAVNGLLVAIVVGVFVNQIGG